MSDGVGEQVLDHASEMLLFAGDVDIRRQFDGEINIDRTTLRTLAMGVGDGFRDLGNVGGVLGIAMVSDEVVEIGSEQIGDEMNEFALSLCLRHRRVHRPAQILIVGQLPQVLQIDHDR